MNKKDLQKKLKNNHQTFDILNIEDKSNEYKQGLIDAIKWIQNNFDTEPNGGTIDDVLCYLELNVRNLKITDKELLINLLNKFKIKYKEGIEEVYNFSSITSGKPYIKIDGCGCAHWFSFEENKNGGNFIAHELSE